MPAPPAARGKSHGGELSSISVSSGKMEVDEGGSGSDKDKEKEKAERERASAAALLEPQVAAASLEPQIFAAAVDLSCPVVELDEEDCSDFSQEDWEEFIASYECAWSEPVVLEGGEPVALEGSMLHVALENFPCDSPNRATVELAESRGVPNRTTVELAESHQVPDRTTVELAESPELSLEAGRFVADFQNGVEHGMLHVVGRPDHGMVAHETAAASQQHDTMDWWLVDSGASAHIINEDTLSRVHVVSHSESASECVSATGDSIGVRRSAVVRVPFVLVSGETVVTELQVLVAPVKFNLLSLGRLLGKSWVVDFLPSFKVEAAGYVLRTRWVSNCGWVFSSAVELDRSVAVAARASLKRSDGCESSSDSEQEWRLSGRRHLAEQHAATVTRTHEDFEGSTVAFTATSMVGLTPGQNLLLVPAAEVKKKTAEQAKAAAKAAAEKFVKERQESAQWAKEAEEAKKKRAAKAAEAKKKAAEAEKLINEGTEAKKRAAEAVELVSDSPEGKKKAAEAEKLVDEATEARKKAAEAEKLASKAAEAKKKAATEAAEAEKKAATEAKKRVAEAAEVTEAKKPKHSVARAKAEPSSGSKDPPQPVVKRQPKPPMVKAMPAKVRKIVLKSRAQRGIPRQTDTALRMLSQRAKEKKKRGYLMKAINNAMKKKAEEQKGAPVRRTWEKHVKDHYAQIRGLEIPFVTISEIVKEPRGPPGPPTVPQPKTPPSTPARAARAPEVKVEGARAAKVPEIIKVEGVEINPPPPVPPRRRLPTPPRDPRSAGRGPSAHSEWSPVCAGGDKGQGHPSDESRGTPAERRAEELRIGDDGKIYNSAGEVVELESIEIDAHHPGISDGPSSLGLTTYHSVTGARPMVSGSRGPAAKEAMLNDMSAWSRSVGLVGVAPSELTVSVKSDIEGVVKNLAQSFADGLTAGAIEVVDAPVGRHAVVAERAVRTIKEGANTLCAGLEQVGLEPCGKGVTYLLMHVAQVYNRYQVHPGSALSPEQRCLKTARGPHAAYVWGAAVLATPPPSLRDKITGRYGHAAYLGPEVGSGSHIVQFRLRDGTLKIARSARIRMLVPLTFEVSSLKGVCRMLPGRRDNAQKKLPESSGDNVRDLPLPNTATRRPPPEWIEENGRTPRCRACRLRDFPADKAWHTQRCRDRYAEFVRNSFDPSRAILDQAPIEEEAAGLDDLGAGFDVDLGLDVPDDLDPFPNFPVDEDLAEYEPSLPGVENEIEVGEELEQIEAPSPGELDFMQVEPEPLEALPEEEREAMVSSVMYRESISFTGASVCFAGAATKVVTPQVVELGGEKLFVEVPASAKDDVTGHLLDIGLTYEGMLRELRALESLAVGDVVWHVDPKQKVISTRWVSNAKVERVEGKENPLVRCRVVARDFAQGATAAQLGISAATSSAEALRTFLFYAGSKRRNIVGLDVSTAFLFADLDEENGHIVVRLPDGVKGKDGRRGYLRLKKALYGLRVAAQTWSRHLAKLLKKLCDLEPCETLKQKQIFIFGVRGEANVADLFTKPLSWTVTLKHMWGLGLRDVAIVAGVLDGFVTLCGAMLVGKSHVSLRDRFAAMPHASWLVIEFCAPVESSMRAASQDLNWVNVLTVSERDDGASAQTLLELKAIFAAQIKKKGFVFLWASTPCTGGCPYQRLRARDPAYRRGRLAQHWRLHRKLWRSLVELTSFVHAWAIEWPRACAYWSWRQTEHFLSSRPYGLHDVPVDGCALDMRGRDHLLIAKRWRVVTTHPAVAESIRVYRCSGKHEHSKDFDLKSTQHYPVELVKSFFEALRL
ncbi:TY1B-NL2 [Symbiodinium sp. CCMP2592]|nr:TY1B-NL2 [Symbiodinium sp. CCMP2592]